MQTMIKNKIVNKDLSTIYETDFINWEEFRNKTVLITGATGGIGSMLVRSFLFANEQSELNIKVIGLVRNIKRAKIFFDNLVKNKNFKLVKNDITEKIKYRGNVDYIIHCANNTSSRSFVEMPVETMEVAFYGTKNVLEFAENKKVTSLVFLSSMEIYGIIENTDKMQSENDLGTLELLNVRNSYPIGKRAAETLCHSFYKEKNVPVKIARLAQTVGANVDYNDPRVYAYFARCIVEKKDIVLNTTGNTIRSYCYITDVITGILLLLQKGENGEAYNIANEDATSKIRDIAEMLTKEYPNSKLVFNIKDTGIFPKETVWALKTDKIQALGWKPNVSKEKMYDNLINSFYKQLNQINNKLYSKTEKWYQKLLSIKNKDFHKVFCFMGIKFKINTASLNAFVIKRLKIKNNKIVFCNYMGNGYGCNPKYICEELIKRNEKVDIVWLVKNNTSTNDFPKRVKIVDYNSKEALLELATSKIWIDNYHKINFIKKGLIKANKQYYVQTWHGSLGIKNIEKKVTCLTDNKKWLDCAIKNSNMTDFWISNSSFESKIYETSFWNVNNIKEFGHPRNDIFFKNDLNKIREKVCKSYNIPLSKKICLYLPSFREDESLEYYNINYKKQINALKHKYGSDWIFLIRLHPRVMKYGSEFIESNDNIIDACTYPDIQELLVAGDVMVSDYSSCMFDFMLSKKPIFIYANDIEFYTAERGFAYPITETPFSIATNNEELEQNILDFDSEKYVQNVEKFLVDKGCMEDGHASERVVDLIEEIINA